MKCFFFTPRKLPVWIRSYVPRFIYLTEKAWNYYPYTETGEVEVQVEVKLDTENSGDSVHFRHGNVLRKILYPQKLNYFTEI